MKNLMFYALLTVFVFYTSRVSNMSLTDSHMTHEAANYDWRVDSNNSRFDADIHLKLAAATYLSPNYSRMNLPVVTHDHALKVYVGVGLRKILEVEEFKQLIKVSLWIREYWRDEFINWDPDDYKGMHTIRVEHGAVWTPDLVLYTNGGEDYEPLSHINVIVTHEGYITYMYPALHNVACHMDISNFPFDEQVCNIELGSWSYDSMSMDLRLKEDNPAEWSNYDFNTAWELTNFTAFEKLTKFGSDQSMEFKTNVYQITIRRYWTIHFFYMLIPILLIQILAVMQFLLPCDSEEKVILGVTIYLSMLVYLLMVSEMLPSTEYIPSIVEYIVSTLFLVGTAEMITIAVLMIHHNGRHDNHTTLPRWARVFFLHWCARVLGMQRYITSDDEHQEKLKKPQNLSETNLVTAACDNQSSDEEDATVVHDNLENEPHKSKTPSSSFTTFISKKAGRHKTKEDTTPASQPTVQNAGDENTPFNAEAAAQQNISSNNPSDWKAYFNDGDDDNGHDDDSGEEYREVEATNRLCKVIPVHSECVSTDYCEHCKTQCAPAYVKSLHHGKFNPRQLQKRLDNKQYEYSVCCCECMKEAVAKKKWSNELVPLKWQPKSDPQAEDIGVGLGRDGQDGGDNVKMNINRSNINDGQEDASSVPDVPESSSAGSSNTSRMNARQRRLNAARSGTGKKTSLALDNTKLADNKERLLLKIYRNLADQRDRLADDDIESEVKCEWQQVAMVLDRMMFLLYIMGTVIVIIRMYAAVPQYDDRPSIEEQLYGDS